MILVRFFKTGIFWVVIPNVPLNICAPIFEHCDGNPRTQSQLCFEVPVEAWSAWCYL